MNPMMKPADRRAGDVADPSQDRGGERLQAGVEAEVLADVAEAQAPDHARRPCEHAAEQEGQGDGLVEVDAHEGRASGPGRSARIARPRRVRVDERLERDHQDQGQDEDEDRQDGDRGAADLDLPVEREDLGGCPVARIRR